MFVTEVRILVKKKWSRWDRKSAQARSAELKLGVGSPSKYLSDTNTQRVPTGWNVLRQV